MKGLKLYACTSLLLGLSFPDLGFSDLPTLTGTASWYSQSDPGIRRHTASGEVFKDSKKTCASWDFDFGTHLKVTNLQNNKSVVCRVNDRGPSKKLHRSIDLSSSAFSQIADRKRGLIRVRIAPQENR